MKYIVISFLLVLSFQLHATQQILEEFDVDRAKFEILQQPLDSYIENKHFHEKFGPPVCSASWRGYKGYWALRNEKLFLDYLITDPCSNKSDMVDAGKLFGKDQYPIEATWYTGTIVVRISKRKYFPTVDNYSSIEYEAVVYRFQEGQLVSRSIDVIREQW